MAEATSKGADVESLSDRGRGLLKPMPEYLCMMMKGWNNLWDPVDNPDGYVMLCVAENKLSVPILDSKIREISSKNPPLPYVFGYQKMDGIPRFQKALANTIEKAVLNEPLDPNHVIALTGVSAILNKIFCIIGSPGDAVLIPAPYYPMFEGDIASRNGLVPIPVHPRENEGSTLPDAESFQRAYDDAKEKGYNPRVLLLTNPNNPTGEIWPESVLQEAVDFACAKNLHLLSDEVYAACIFNAQKPYKSAYTIANKSTSLSAEWRDNYVHFVYGLSKDFCMSGFRVGVLYTKNKAIRSALGGLALFSTIPNFVQDILSKLLEDSGFVQEYIQENNRILQEATKMAMNVFDDMKVPYIIPEAGMFMWVDLSDRLPEKTFEAETKLWRSFYDDCQVLLTPGKDCRSSVPGFFRLCYASVPTATLKEGLDRIKKYLSKEDESQNKRAKLN